jgi:hypothetical protein
MSAKLDLTGMTFGRLTVIRFDSITGHGNSNWECMCECGTVKVIMGNNLVRGHIRSCGCLSRAMTVTRNTKHGESRRGTKSPEYNAFCRAKNRCESKKNKCYKDYGGRGIQFKFRSIDELLADIGRRPGPEYSLDRMNNNGHYEAGNVRWATAKEQVHNRRLKRLDQFIDEDLMDELEYRGYSVTLAY